MSSDSDFSDIDITNEDINKQKNSDPFEQDVEVSNDMSLKNKILDLLFWLYFKFTDLKFYIELYSVEHKNTVECIKIIIFLNNLNLISIDYMYFKIYKLWKIN